MRNSKVHMDRHEAVHNGRRNKSYAAYLKMKLWESVYIFKEGYTCMASSQCFVQTFLTNVYDLPKKLQ